MTTRYPQRALEIDTLLQNYEKASAEVGNWKSGTDGHSAAAKERAIFRNEIRARLLGAASLSETATPGERPAGIPSALVDERMCVCGHGRGAHASHEWLDEWYLCEYLANNELCPCEEFTPRSVAASSSPSPASSPSPEHVEPCDFYREVERVSGLLVDADPNHSFSSVADHLADLLRRGFPPASSPSQESEPPKETTE